MPHCPKEIRASAAENDAGAEYFAKNKEQIRKDLEAGEKIEHVWLGERGTSIRIR